MGQGRNVPGSGSVVRSASYNTITRVVSAFFGYINLVLVARILDINDFGIYAFLINLLAIAYIVANVGMENTLLVLLPKRRETGDYRDSNGTLVTALAYTLGASIVLLAGLWLATPLFSSMFESTHSIRLFFLIMLASIPFQAIVVYSRVVNQANFQFLRSTFPENVIRPVSYFLMLCAFLLWFRDMGELVLWGYLASFILACAFAYTWVMKSTKLSFRRSDVKHDAEVIKLAPQFMSIQMLNQIAPFVVTFIMGLYLAAEFLGYFRASQQTSALIAFTLRSLEMVFAPMIATLYLTKDMPAISRLYKSITKWIFATGGWISIVAIIGAELVMNAFGDRFATAAYALQILAVGQLVNAASGSCEYLLMMTGRQKTVVYTTVMQVALVTVLSLVLIPVWGLLGAVLAVSVGIIAFKATLIVIVYRKLGITPFSKTYWGTAASILISFLFTYAVYRAVGTEDWMLSLAVLAAASTVSFVLLFWKLGLSAEEKTTVFARVKRLYIKPSRSGAR
ncbi:oligosaccharide flippase family protein [Paenibacillus gansuensis]|uniref:Oligosaccharide flippase family protein n=1 Tax=Paenibacillus gansuensis TaxID=306542 RepID=A0ABW5P7Z9_9BACL